jgi:hypothetical protein
VRKRLVSYVRFRCRGTPTSVSALRWRARVQANASRTWPRCGLGHPSNLPPSTLGNDRVDQAIRLKARAVLDAFEMASAWIHRRVYAAPGGPGGDLSCALGPNPSRFCNFQGRSTM